MLASKGITIIFAAVLFSFFFIPAIVGLIFKGSTRRRVGGTDDESRHRL